jgi:hypothetical protein
MALFSIQATIYSVFGVTCNCHVKVIPINYKIQSIYPAQNIFLPSLELFAELYYVSAAGFSDDRRVRIIT